MEMVVAAAVFAISVLVLFGIFPITARSVAQAEQRLMANHLAANRLEMARTSAFNNVISTAPQTAVVIFRHHDESVEQEFDVEQVVTPSGADPGIKNVEVIVRWKYQDRNQELRLETQIASLSL